MPDHQPVGLGVGRMAAQRLRNRLFMTRPMNVVQQDIGRGGSNG